MKPTILIVDDEAGVRSALSGVLRDEGYQVDAVESAVRAIKIGAFDFVEKPLSLEKTVLVIGHALRQRRLEAENRALRATVDRRLTMIGESYAIAQLREQIA